MDSMIYFVLLVWGMQSMCILATGKEDYMSEAFSTRHRRRLVDKTAIPYVTAQSIPFYAEPCIPDASGIYGSQTTKQLDIFYNYQIQFAESGIDKLSSEILPLVEKTLAKNIAVNLFEKCSQRTLRNKKVQVLDDRSLSRMNIAGVSSLPADKVAEDDVCWRSLLSPVTPCRVVEGGMSLFTNTDLSASNIQNIEATGAIVLLMIKRNMDNGLLDRSHEDIVKVSFLGLHVNTDNISISSETISTKDSTSGFAGRPYGVISIASCFVIALIATIAIGSRCDVDEGKEGSAHEYRDDIPSYDMSSIIHAGGYYSANVSDSRPSDE